MTETTASAQLSETAIQERATLTGLSLCQSVTYDMLMGGTMTLMKHRTGWMLTIDFEHPDLPKHYQGCPTIELALEFIRDYCGPTPNLRVA